MVPAPFPVVLDANVLFPFTLRDTLLRAAAADFYQARWSAEILNEMERNLISTGTMVADKAARLRAVMTREFPEAEVSGYEHLIAVMKNHEKDRHVAAAAVKAGAQVIVTANLRDFTILPDGVEAQSADEFLQNLFDLDPGSFVGLLRDQAEDLVNPPMTFGELLDRLARVVPILVSAVRAHVGQQVGPHHPAPARSAEDGETAAVTSNQPYAAAAACKRCKTVRGLPVQGLAPRPQPVLAPYTCREPDPSQPDGCCGGEVWTYDDNELGRRYAKKLGIPVRS